MDTNPYETPETMGHEAAAKAGCFRFVSRGFLAVIGVLGFLFICVLPNVRFPMPREAARRTQCASNLKQIAVALQNYEYKYGCLPPAYTVDDEGQPLHSWRTLILPFLEESQLYEMIDLTRPWDDPANQKAFEKMPKIYRCPSNGFELGYTGYLAVSSPGGCFAGPEPRTLWQITDKHDHTLMMIEVSPERAVPWMKPQDADEETVLSAFKDRSQPHFGGAQAILVDGSTRFLPADTEPEILQAMMTIAGGDDKIIESGAH